MDKPVIVRDGKRLSRLSTDELIEEVGKQGYIINNLFQVKKDNTWIWRCNLQQQLSEHDWFHEFGDGNTMRKAIFVALHNAYYAANTSNQVAKRHLQR